MRTLIGTKALMLDKELSVVIAFGLFSLLVCLLFVLFVISLAVKLYNS